MTKPRVCFLGNERSGSWKIRGEQIASQRPYWHAATELTEEALDAYDLFCVVKEFKKGWKKALKRRGKSVVVDIVDGWKQPDDDLRVKDGTDARALFKARWERWQFADAFIFPTKAMRDDLEAIAPLSRSIYHHYRPGIEPNPVRPTVRKIGYEGLPRYLSTWRGTIESYCKTKNLEYVTNPKSLAELDIGFAARGGEHDSYLTRRYKSNVKLANFYGSGTPCVVQSGQSAYHETDCGAVKFFRDEAELVYALDALVNDHQERRASHDAFLKASADFSIETIADIYDDFFDEVTAWQRGSGRMFSFAAAFKRLVTG